MDNPHFMLTFGTTTGASRTLRVPHANENVTDNAVRVAMNQIVSADAFAGRTGRLANIRRAQLVRIQRVPLQVV